MNEDRVVEPRHPEAFSEDPLTAVLRSGARRLLAQAIEIGVSGFLSAHADLKDDLGRQLLVRHGHHRERGVQTGTGKIRFTSAILPPYLGRAKSVEEFLPWLYPRPASKVHET